MNFKYIKKDHVMRSYDEQVRFLDINGNLIDKNVDTELTKDQLLDAYKWMVLSRQQDTYMTQLQKQGRMLSFAPNFGEEALQVASAFALKKEDWFAPAFRSNATMLALGVPIKNQLLYWNGQERGSVTPVGVNVLPINIPIATQYSHAAGIAYAAKLQGKKTVAMSIVGNGGTGEGEFYEAMNISSIWKWPAVFTVNNNQWAISTPFKYGSGSKTIAQKAEAVGIPGVIVDGSDLLASYAVIKEAVEWARGGNGPVLVEFLTWRQGVHTSSDNPRIYRTEEEEKEHEKWEPFHRIEKYLKDKKYITDEEIKQIWDSSLDKVKTTYEESLKELDTQLDEIFDHTYATLTQELKEQKQHAKDYYAKEGK